jgi:diguanylate cyclase
MCDESKLDVLRTENTKLLLEIERLKDLAFTDPLTGLGNRRVFTDDLNRKVKQYARYIYSNFIADDNNFSLILFDLDKFKSVNDTFGHSVGDKVLQEVAKVALEHIRSSDTLVRYGGEEFAIIVTGEIRAACLLAERIRESIEKMNVEELGFDTKKRSNITASFGASQYVWLGEQVTSIDMLINGADIRLYKAKECGRNLTVSKDF